MTNTKPTVTTVNYSNRFQVNIQYNHMRNVFFLLIINATNVFSQSDTINRLNFPYRAGYNMYFSQYSTYYTNAVEIKSGAESETIEDVGSFQYHINREFLEGTDTIVNFLIISRTGGDSVYIESPLYINNDGMFFKMPKEAIEKAVAYYKITDKKNLLFQTIKTPLYKGMSWESYNYSFLKTTYFCTHVDTLIETPLGKFSAFGIGTSSATTELRGKFKDYNMITEYQSFYAQDVGKIAEYTNVYLQDKSTGEKILSTTIEVFLEEIWWDE
ncbi:MAG: hypothetical protein KBD42_05115 [Chitinophagales bacterium]|nr:hypothetical protein [Chitinophagales bacterium]